MTAKPLVQVGAFAPGSHTLVVRHGHGKKRNKHPPYAETVDNGRKYAAAVELCDHVGDFCVGRGRNEAHVGGHGETAGRRDAAVVGRSVDARIDGTGLSTESDADIGKRVAV